MLGAKHCMYSKLEVTVVSDISVIETHMANNSMLMLMLRRHVVDDKISKLTPH